MRLRFRRTSACRLCIFLAILAVAVSPASSSSGKSEVLHIGLIEENFIGTNIQDARLAEEVLFRSMSKRMTDATMKVEYVPQVAVYKDVSSILAAMKKGEVDLTSFFTCDYLKAREKVQMDPILVSRRGNSIYEKYCLVARREGTKNTLTALKGKKFIIYQMGSGEHPRLWIDTLLLKNEKCPCGSFFSSVKKVTDIKKALLPVYFGQADACVITRRGFDVESEQNPAILNKLVVIEDSPELLPIVLCVRHDFDPSIREKLVKTAVTIHKDPEGHQALTILRLDGMAFYDPDYVKSVADLLREYSRLTTRKSK